MHYSTSYSASRDKMERTWCEGVQPFRVLKDVLANPLRDAEASEVILGGPMSGPEVFPSALRARIRAIPSPASRKDLRESVCHRRLELLRLYVRRRCRSDQSITPTLAQEKALMVQASWQSHDDGMTQEVLHDKDPEGRTWGSMADSPVVTSRTNRSFLSENSRDRPKDRLSKEDIASKEPCVGNVESRRRRFNFKPICEEIEKKGIQALLNHAEKVCQQTGSSGCDDWDVRIPQCNHSSEPTLLQRVPRQLPRRGSQSRRSGIRGEDYLHQPRIVDQASRKEEEPRRQQALDKKMSRQQILQMIRVSCHREEGQETEAGCEERPKDDVTQRQDDGAATRQQHDGWLGREAREMSAKQLGTYDGSSITGSAPQGPPRKPDRRQAGAQVKVVAPVPCTACRSTLHRVFHVRESLQRGSSAKMPMTRLCGNCPSCLISLSGAPECTDKVWCNTCGSVYHSLLYEEPSSNTTEVAVIQGNAVCTDFGTSSGVGGVGTVPLSQVCDQVMSRMETTKAAPHLEVRSTNPHQVIVSVSDVKEIKSLHGVRSNGVQVILELATDAKEAREGLQFNSGKRSVQAWYNSPGLNHGGSPTRGVF